MSAEQYKAKQHYQDKAIADTYDDQRFRGWRGRIVHRAESTLLKHTLNNHFQPGGTVLDLPCGTGRLLDVYSEGGFIVTGCDISEKMLAHARRRFENDQHFRFQTANAEALPFEDNTFDYLVSFRFVLHLPRKIRRKVLAEMVRVTRQTLAVNFYFNYPTPVLLMNQLLRRIGSIPPHRIRESQLPAEFKGLGVHIRNITKLVWFDRNWALVILEKTTVPQP